jgi:TonB family protein
MNFRNVPVFLMFLIQGSAIHGIAQDTSSVLPQDPTVLMALGHDKNGLAGSDIKPWHIRGAYHSYDTKGKPEYEGAYEEWWVSATKYKLSFTNPKSTQTDYATGTVLLREGPQEWQSGFELLLRASLLEPLPDVSQLNGFTLKRGAKTVGQSSIECVDLTYPVPLEVSGSFYPAACFEPTIPALRVYSEGSTRIIYDHIVSFQGHYLARQIQVFVSGKLAAEMNLDVVESLKQSPDTVLAAPSTALPVDLTKIMFKDPTRSHWPATLRKALPVYPQNAKSMRIQGTVNIKVTIGPDGHVESLNLIDGPQVLRKAAMDSVQQWLFRPFDLMGQPRRVELELHVIFRLG